MRSGWIRTAAPGWVTGVAPATPSLAGLALFVALLLPGPAAALGDRGADGEYERRDSSHFTLYQDVDIDETGGLRGSRRFEQDVLAVLEDAYLRLDAMLGLRAANRIVVTVHDPGLFDQQFAGLFRFPAAGFYGGEIHVRGDVVVTEALVRTLHHELVHATFDATRPNLILPAWLNEGIAEWFEARARGKRYLSRGEAGYLQDLAQRGGLIGFAQMSYPSFGHLGPNAAGLAYLQSYAFIEYLTRSHGEGVLERFCSSYLKSGDLERALKRTFRADLEQLERRFFDSVRSGQG